MMKKFFSVAFVALALTSSSAFAQQKTDAASAGCTKTECSAKSDCKKDNKDCKKAKDCKKGKKDQKAKDGKMAMQGKKMRGQQNPFEGLTLTDAQKAQLTQLNESRKAQREAKMAQAKDQKMVSDSLRAADRAQAKRDYLEQVKAIVGPDQYVVFLENFYVNAPAGGQKAMRADGHKGEGKAFRQGDRPSDKAGFAKQKDGKHKDKAAKMRKDSKSDKKNS